jgi:hypothetical protein
MCAVIAAREKELQKIRDGELTATKKPKPTSQTKKEAFNKYLKMFFDLPEIEVWFCLSLAILHLAIEV